MSGRDQALSQLGRILCVSLARQRGGVWSVPPRDERPGREAPRTFPGQIDGVPDRDDMESVHDGTCLLYTSPSPRDRS